MMKKYRIVFFYFCVLFLLFFNYSLGQENFTKKQLDSLVDSYRYGKIKDENSKDAIVEIDNLLPKIKDDSLKIYFIRQKAFLYSRMRDIPNVLKSHLETKDLVKQLNSDIENLNFHLALSETYLFLKMYDLSYKNLDECEKYIKKMIQANKEVPQLFAYDIIKQKALHEGGKNNESIRFAYSNLKRYQNIKNEKTRNLVIMLTNQLMAKAYLELKDYTNARKHITLAFKLQAPYESGFKFTNNNTFAKLLLETGKIDSAELVINAFKLKNEHLWPDEQAEKSNLLAKIYALKNNSDKATYYLIKKDSLEKRNNQVNMKAVEKSLQYSEKENKEIVKSRDSIIYILIPLVLMGIALVFYYKRKKEIEVKQYEKIIKSLKEHKPIYSGQTLKIDPEKKEPGTGSTLNEEKESEILALLHKFEAKEKYRDSNISLPDLAAQFKTNTTYLSEVINTHKGKNFNTYINELRINYIVQKLYENKEYRQYKISYLAEDSGFTSHSAFATIFKNTLGITPSVFINNLKNTTT